jgi:hypothetical protein
MSTKKPTNPLAAKILAFLTPVDRQTSEEIARGIGEDIQAVWLELADLEYRDKVLSELVGTPVVRTYRLNARKKAPKCKHEGPFAVVSLANFLFAGPKGRIGEEGMTDPEVLCCKCGAMRSRKDCNGQRWSIPLAEEMSDPLLVRDGFPEGSAIVVHAANLRNEDEVDREGEKAFAKWVDLDYGRRLLYGRLREEDMPRAERDAAEHARTSFPG